MGRKFFIDRDTGDDSADGTSPDRAWQHIDRASEMEYKPDMALLLEGGQVHEGTLTVRGAGAEDAPIVISSYGGNGQPAIIKEKDPDNKNKVAVRLLADYVTMRDLVMKDARYAAVESYQTHHHITLEDMRLLHNAAGFRCKSSYATVRRCVLSSTLMADDSGDADDNGAFPLSFEPIDNYPIEHIRVYDNSFIGNKAKSKKFRRDGELGFYRSVKDVKVFGNYFDGNKTIMEWGGNGVRHVIEGIEFFDNTMLNNYGRWLFVNDPAGGFAVTPRRVHFYHNRFVDALNPNTPLFFAGTDEDWQELRLEQEFRLTRNIIYSRSTIANQKLTTAANLFWREGGGDIGFVPDATDMVADPMFVDARAGDLRRLAGAPMPGAGVRRQPVAERVAAPMMLRVENRAHLLDMYDVAEGSICYVKNEGSHYKRTHRGWMVA
ncbi:MAG: hypothetical protein ACPG7F_00530 [Aggregatilineales bacterium]